MKKNEYKDAKKKFMNIVTRHYSPAKHLTNDVFKNETEELKKILKKEQLFEEYIEKITKEIKQASSDYIYVLKDKNTEVTTALVKKIEIIVPDIIDFVKLKYKYHKFSVSDWDEKTLELYQKRIDKAKQESKELFDLIKIVDSEE